MQFSLQLHCALLIKIIEGRSFISTDANGYGDPYVTVDFDKTRKLHTSVKTATLNPVWNEEFLIPIIQDVKEIIICCKDLDFIGCDKIGYLVFKAEELLKYKIISGWYEMNRYKIVIDSLGNIKDIGQWQKINGKFSKHKKFRGTLNIHLEIYEYGSGYEVKYVYSPLRECNKFKLYQDARVHVEEITGPILGNGKTYEVNSVWKDLYLHICKARKFIYITGWSLWTEVELVRDEDVEKKTGYSSNLGKLLSAKAREGVALAALLWNEKLSVHTNLLKAEGVMCTHDETTREYFEALNLDNVKIKLAARYGSQGAVTQFWFTHHQKSVILDAEGPDHKRKIVAYIGGLDLCDGRYDTPTHSLFRTLSGVHKNDFHNVWEITQEYGPRQPWHDIHSFVEGPAARDVLENFLMRWEKQADKYLSVLYDIKHDPELLSYEEEVLDLKQKHKEKEMFNVQLFRSIDSHSANFNKAYNRAVDNSICMAYLHFIKKAEKFIYIENQYFLGSCQSWKRHKKSGCYNLVPLEIAKKIVYKIERNERFAVYIVIPMHPEGIPEESSVQEILRWESETMKMMYKKISHALQKTNCSHSPLDYLRFFCLGNRETSVGAASEAPSKSAHPRQRKVYARRNFMIYVHSKLMIVDDEYAILGSANINERSLAGDRDTEICIGGYQPGHVYKNGNTPRGEIFGFRKCLFQEHLGIDDPLYDKPWELECIRQVAKLAENNWKLFTQKKVVEMKGHLLVYPMDVARNGQVRYRTRGKYFPNTTAKIKGSSKRQIPDAITT